MGLSNSKHCLREAPQELVISPFVRKSPKPVPQLSRGNPVKPSNVGPSTSRVNRVTGFASTMSQEGTRLLARADVKGDKFGMDAGLMELLLKPYLQPSEATEVDEGRQGQAPLSQSM